MVSPVGRDTPRDAAKNVATTDDDGNLDTELPRVDQILGDAVNGALVNPEGIAAGEILT